MLQKEIWPFELKTESALEPKMWTAEELNLLCRHNLDRQTDTALHNSKAQTV